MRDGTRQVNNPARVPDTLTVIDGPQEGARRVIHPVAMVVGVASKEHEMYRRAEPEFFEVPKDGTYIDHRGSPIAFKKGDRIPLSRAAQFKDFNLDLSGRHVSGITPARADVPATTTAQAAEGTVVPEGETTVVDPEALRQAVAEGRVDITELAAIVAEHQQGDDVNQRQDAAPENRMEPGPQTPEQGREAAPENRSEEQADDKPAGKKSTNKKSGE